MRLNRYLSLGLVFAFASTSALAFQEQSGGTAAPAESAPAVEGSAPADAALAPGAAVKSAPAGTEVRIPGLGKLGVLPKMDFGLELLYGANEPKPDQEDRDVPEGDLTIRGSIKHPF